MVNPQRVTAAFDKATADLLEKITSEKQISQSEAIRQALKFYDENRFIEDQAVKKRVHEYANMLLVGEHIILDSDHWLLFLRLISLVPAADREKFWQEYRQIAKAHSEQLKNHVHSLGDLLVRLEICNFFRLIENSPNDFTLVLSNEESREFIKIFIQEYCLAMDIPIEIKENLTKLRIQAKHSSNDRRQTNYR